MVQSILLISFQTQLWKLEVINSISLLGSKNVWKTITELSNCGRIFIKRSKVTISVQYTFYFFKKWVVIAYIPSHTKDYNSPHPDFILAILVGFFCFVLNIYYLLLSPRTAQWGSLMYALTLDRHKFGRSTDILSSTDRHPISNHLYLVAHSTFYQLSDQLTSINQSSAPVL